MTDLVSVTPSAGTELADVVATSSDLRIRWLSATPWIAEAFVRYVSREGTLHGGVHSVRGRDNAVCTLKAYLIWTSDAERYIETMSGSEVTVSNGVSERTAILGTPAVTEYVPGTSVTLTVDAREV